MAPRDRYSRVNSVRQSFPDLPSSSSRRGSFLGTSPTVFLLFAALGRSRSRSGSEYFRARRFRNSLRNALYGPRRHTVSPLNPRRVRRVFDARARNEVHRRRDVAFARRETSDSFEDPVLKALRSSAFRPPSRTSTALYSVKMHAQVQRRVLYRRGHPI